MSGRILVADDDPGVRGAIELHLKVEGFEVLEAEDGPSTLEIARREAPDLVLLDVMMPGMDGFEVCRRLRADPRTTHIPVIVLTAKSLAVDKVVGLAAGADDYVAKPFDPDELVARIRTTLRRTADLRGASPLTGLPGNHRIETEIATRLASGTPIAVAYVDLNDFKAFNDHYGFLRGDEAILLIADVLREALTAIGGEDVFLGQIGGDDLGGGRPPAPAAGVGRHGVAEFDRRVPALYDPEDLERGWIEVTTRRGDIDRFGVMTVAIGVASTARRTFTDHRHLVQVATEMKSYVKGADRQVSAWAIDSRTDR